MKQAIIYALPLLTTPFVSSFLLPTTTHQTTPAFLPTPQINTNPHTPTPTTLSLAGFGGAAKSSSSSKKGNKKKTGGGGGASATPLKLKPKAQWTKFKSLTNESSVTVAMRVVAKEGSDDVGQWFDVGMIKSEGDEFTEVAVALQKGIITEHARRLHPLQFLPKDKFEWGYASSSSDDSTDTVDWILLDVKQMTPPPPGVEKKIGFQGNADPSGFYKSIGKWGYADVSTKKDINKPIN